MNRGGLDFRSLNTVALIGNSVPHAVAMRSLRPVHVLDGWPPSAFQSRNAHETNLIMAQRLEPRLPSAADVLQIGNEWKADQRG